METYCLEHLSFATIMRERTTSEVLGPVFPLVIYHLPYSVFLFTTEPKPVETEVMTSGAGVDLTTPLLIDLTHDVDMRRRYEARVAANRGVGLGMGLLGIVMVPVGIFGLWAAMAGSGSDASLAIGLSSMYVGPVFITGGFALRKRARTRQGRVGRYWKPEELETIEEEHNTALCGSLGQSMVACNQATSFRPECEFSTTDMEDIQRDLEELEELKDLHQEFDVDWDD